MSRRTTIERILRDDNDPAAQTVRQWAIVKDDPGGIMIRERSDEKGTGFILLREEDVPLFIEDLKEIIGGRSDETD